MSASKRELKEAIREAEAVAAHTCASHTELERRLFNALIRARDAEAKLRAVRVFASYRPVEKRDLDWLEESLREMLSQVNGKEDLLLTPDEPVEGMQGLDSDTARLIEELRQWGRDRNAIYSGTLALRAADALAAAEERAGQEVRAPAHRHPR